MLGTPGPVRPAWARVGIVLAAVYGAFWAQFSAVRLDNFGGVDEWLVLSLSSHGILSVPYANRPLGLLFNVPVALFPSHLLGASFLLHGHYLVLAGILTSLLVLRVAPGRHDWALLAGVFAATWAPSDLFRLDSIYSSAYSGITAATIGVLFLLTIAAGRPAVIAAAAGLAFVTIRIHEGALPLLLIAPLLLLGLGVRLDRSTLLAYGSVMALGALVIALPLLLRDQPGSVYRLADGFPALRGRPESWYQAEIMRPDLDPGGLLSRLGEQFRLHLAPLFQTLPSAFLKPRPIISAAMVVVAMAVLGPSAETTGSRRRFATAALVGIVGAAAAYSAFIVATHLDGASRTEFLAAPWIGLTLSAAIGLAAGALPLRARFPAIALLGAVVVATAAARTSQVQEAWERVSKYAPQASSLAQIVSTAGTLKPGTIVVLLDGAQAWLGTYSFHHALDLVYGPHVAGCVPNAPEQIFYFCDQGPDGVHLEPWNIIKAPWGVESRVFRFDQVVIFRSDASGRVTLVDEWPAELPAPGPGPGYAPRLRFEPSPSPPATRSVLGAGGATRTRG